MLSLTRVTSLLVLLGILNSSPISVSAQQLCGGLAELSCPPKQVCSFSKFADPGDDAALGYCSPLILPCGIKNLAKCPTGFECSMGPGMKRADGSGLCGVAKNIPTITLAEYAVDCCRSLVDNVNGNPNSCDIFSTDIDERSYCGGFLDAADAAKKGKHLPVPTAEEINSCCLSMVAANDQVGNPRLCKPLGGADIDLCAPYLPRQESLTQTKRQLPRSTRGGRPVKLAARAVKRDEAEVNTIDDEVEDEQSDKAKSLQRTLRKIERLLRKVERETVNQEEY